MELVAIEPEMHHEVCFLCQLVDDGLFKNAKLRKEMVSVQDIRRKCKLNELGQHRVPILLLEGKNLALLNVRSQILSSCKSV